MSDKVSNEETNGASAEEAIESAVANATPAEAQALAEDAQEVAEVLMAENSDEDAVIDAIDLATEAEAVAEAAPKADAEAVRGPSGYVESEGGRPSRIGSGVKASDVDYKNIALLSRFLDRRGRILSRRKTRVSAKVQRRVAQAIKRARHLALLPYTSDQTRVVRKRR
jgi:ribosomal protein S18